MVAAFDDARAVIEAASPAEFNLLPYDGGETDLGYLKDWVLSQVETIYNVSADVFSQATVYSTSILRDFVNRAVYQNSDATDFGTIIANGDLQYSQVDDVATAFRYPAYSSCALLAYQEYRVFQAFGYKTTDISFINSDFSSYTDSHTSTEVYVTDLNKSIIQDATFNFMFEDQNGTPLSWFEAAAAARNGTLQFNHFDSYTYWQTTGVAETGPEPQATIDTFMQNYFDVPFLWASNGGEPGADGSLYEMFNYWPTAHSEGYTQRNPYASVDDAWDDISALASQQYSWSQIAQTIDNSTNHYASGFRVGQTEWITVETPDNYVSFNIHTGDYLYGSYDQIMDEATGGDTDLNPGSDLSFMLQPSDLLTSYGDVMDSWVNPATSPGVLTIRNDATGALKLWTVDGSLTNAITLPTPDKAYTLEDRGDYDGDGHADLLFYNHTNGQVGYWDENNAWHRLDTLSSAWAEQSHTGTSDFYSDGADDILWRNTTTNEIVSWDMLDGAKVAYQSYGTVAATDQIVATGDLNADGTDDILWRNTSTGEIHEWIMQNGLIQSNQHIDTVNLGWQIIGTGDFTNDGATDFLWYNTTTMEVMYWNIVNGQHASSQHLDYLGSNWKVESIIDTNHDGTDDIIWQNSNNGSLVTWEMHNGTQLTSADGTLSSGWHIA